VLWAPIGFWRKILFLTVWDEYNMVAKNQLVNWNLFHFFFKKKYTSLSWWLDEVYTPPRINLDNHKNAMAEWAQWKVQIFKYSLLPATSSCHILPQVWGNSWWILAPYWSPQEYSSRFLLLWSISKRCWCGTPLHLAHWVFFKQWVCNYQHIEY
jgi:hypothetical protein